MKKTVISGVFALLFLGSLLFAQAATDVTSVPRPPVPPTPPRPVEMRYYEGTAVIQYKYGTTTSDPSLYTKTIKGTAYLWVERDVYSNLFRMRYAICYKEGNIGICEGSVSSNWMRGEVNAKGVWVIKQDDSVARLGLKDGSVRLDEGRRIITMELRLKQPLGTPVVPIEENLTTS